ncbi:MAG: GxxExxY protein [Desulfomonilaceae bacterium]
MTRASNKTTETMIGAAIEGHRQLGPSLLESTYEACLAYEWAPTRNTSSCKQVEGVFASAFSALSAVNDYNYSVANRSFAREICRV